ncbi:site-specific integrase [Microvirga sp. BT291]|nr:site-specific integrase [Microvirga pudoricolor]
MAITYMQRRRSGIYEFRRMLPRSLAGKPVPAYAREALAELTNLKTGRFKRELTVSLQTTDLREGKKRDLREGVRVAELFALAERLIAHGPQATGGLDLEDLQASVMAELLAADEEAREEGDDRRRLQTAEERSQWPDLIGVSGPQAKGMEEDHFGAYGEALEELEADYRKAQARRDPKIVDPELRTYLKKHGIPVDPSASWYRDAGLAVLQAHVKAYGLMRERQGGDEVPTPKLASDKGPKLSEAYEAWKAGSPARGSKKPGANTVREADHAVRRFKEMHGDMRLAAITRERAREFRDALARVPTRLPAKLKALPIREVLKTPSVAKLPPPHSGTINKSLSLLSAIVSNAEREGHLDAAPGFVNPFGKGLKLAVDDRDADTREPFTVADLKAIFSTPVYSAGQRPEGGGGEAAYWLPLIALLTGARQGELAQLRIGDLKPDPESGIWHFDIGTEGGRSIKTASSRRKVPVHPELERLGLLRYRQALLDRGAGLQDSLWPDIKSDSQGRRAGPWSKWFNRYLRDKAGVDDAGKVFHSFRHTFKRMARDAGLSEEMHDALTGHTGGGVGRSYGGGFGLRAMAESLERLEVPEVVQNLSM